MKINGIKFDINTKRCELSKSRQAKNSRIQDYDIGASVNFLEIRNLQSCYFSL